MQMFITKQHPVFIYLILLLCTIETVIADTSFNEAFQVDPIINDKLANRVTTYYSEDISLPLNQQKTELLEIEDELDSISNIYEKKPVYWFIKGLNYRNIAACYSELKKDQLSISQIHKKNDAYKQAIELDSGAEKKLSPSIYSTMKHGLPQDLKIQAIQKELTLGGNGESESYYWYLHWSNIDQLQKAGRTEDAKKAMKNMQEELKNSDIDVSIYKDLSKKIEKKTFSNNIKPIESKPRKKENIQLEPKEKPSPANKKNIIIFSVAFISILLALIVTIYELKIKKRK